MNESIPGTFSGGAETAQAPAVHAVIPAYGGPDRLAQALASLATERPWLRAAIVVNNACDATVDRVAAAAPVPTTVIRPPCNLGTAGGLTAGSRAMLERCEATHAWIMDDDAVVVPGALATLLEGMKTCGADLAAPLITEGPERVHWVPCRLPRGVRRELRRGLTPAEFAQVCGPGPRRLNWAGWAGVLLTRRALEATGFPRLDLWSQFSDIEYTLRVTERFSGVLVPTAVCRHLPAVTRGAGFEVKLQAALQNGYFVALRLSHSRRAWRHLPGLLLRYLHHYRWTPGAWRRAAQACWDGAVRGRPSGRTLQAADLARAERALAGREE